MEIVVKDSGGGAILFVSENFIIGLVKIRV